MPESKTEYYLVDNEIFVKLSQISSENGEVVIGTNDLGNPYNPIRAIINGRKITEQEFLDGSAKRRAQYPKFSKKPNAT